VAWPLHGLALRTPDLVLRGMTEADAVALEQVLPADVDTDPALPDLGHPVLQSYWRAAGRWSLADWELPFAVEHGGELVGVQGLEGKDFGVLKTVDSYSWLVPAARGRGLGTQMRAAVLALAFGSLGAVRAVSEAFETNVASLGVSWRLGYVDNGVDLHRDGDQVVRMQRLRLDARDWIPPFPVEVTGLAPCLPLLGV
jgi:RimJ/RimL family protein N-acetyltransferase